MSRSLGLRTNDSNRAICGVGWREKNGVSFDGFSYISTFRVAEEIERFRGATRTFVSRKFAHHAKHAEKETGKNYFSIFSDEVA